MTAFRRLAGALRALFRRTRVAQELDEELRAYLDAAVDEKMAAGLSRADAERAARVDIGSLAAVKDDTHDVGWESWVQSIGRDVRYSLRSLRRAPWYTTGVVGVLSLGLALATVAFAVVDGVLFKPLPYDRPHELFLIQADATSAPRPDALPVSWREVGAWTAAVPDVAVTVMSVNSSTFETAENRERVTASIDEHFFATLGVRPLMGGFGSDDYDSAWREQPVWLEPTLISYHDWQRQYGADLDVIGRVVIRRENDGGQFGIRIVGVLPPAFVLPVDGREVAALSPLPGGVARPLHVVARVPSPDAVHVEQRLIGATERLAQEPPPPALHGRQSLPSPFDRVELVPIREHLTASERPAFAIVFAATALLLLLASVNVAGLAAARNVERRGDLAICRALGASTTSVVRGVLVETAVLASVATAVGLLIAKPLLVWTIDLLPATIVLLKEPTLDPRTFVASAAFAVICIVVVGLWPAIVAANSTVRLTPLASSTSTRRTRRSHAAIVALQAALGVVLVTAGGLTMASVAAAYRNDTGYLRDRAILLEVFAQHTTGGTSPVETLRALPGPIAGVPGVRDVAVSTINPLFAQRANAWTSVVPDGWAGDVEGIVSRHVSANFFDLLGVRLVDGRWPAPGEWGVDQPVAVVSETAARRLWPDRSAVGQTLVARSSPLTPAMRTVIGVVADARYAGLDAPPLGDIYLPDALAPGSGRTGVFFHVGTSTTAADVLPAVLAVLGGRGLAITQASTHEDALFASIKHRVLPAWLFGSLGLGALVMLGVGTLGLLAMAVAQRTREIGVRMALGATPLRVVGLLVGEQLVPVVAGILAGAAVSVWAVRLVEAQLYGVGIYDPAVWITVALALVAVAALGTLLPSVRAMRIEPVRVLKSD